MLRTVMPNFDFGSLIFNGLRLQPGPYDLFPAAHQCFHSRLEPFHGIEVLVGYDIFDASKVWVSRLEDEGGAPVAGALICVASFFNNKHAYVPKTMRDSAVERRAKGRLKRIEVHRREAIEEANPQMRSEDIPSMTVDRLVALPAPRCRLSETVMPKVEAGLDRRENSANAMPADQYELADHCIAHPGDMTANQRRLLVQLFNAPSARELFELKGGSIEDLRDLLTATAPGSSSALQLGSLQSSRQGNPL